VSNIDPLLSQPAFCQFLTDVVECFDRKFLADDLEQV
jgi:hypothetical protein